VAANVVVFLLNEIEKVKQMLLLFLNVLLRECLCICIIA